MNILFLTDNFPPEGNAPATRTFEHAVEWVKLGHNVTVITGAPNFPEGKVFKGYKNKWFSKEDMNGIRVIRVKTFISANEGFLKRTLDYMSFMVTSFFAGLFVKKVDLVVGTSPQFFTVISAWLLSVFKRLPFVFELRDIWPASITAVGAMNESSTVKLLEKLELFLYRRATKIIAVTNSFKSELKSRGIDEAKVEVILNGVDLSVYSPEIKKNSRLSAQYGLEGKFVVGYVGTHGLAHALNNIVETAEMMKDVDDVVFLFAGGGAGAEEVKQLVINKGLKNVRVLGRQEKSMMPQIWSLCDVSLVHLKNVPLFKSVIPSKIFESMGMGLPIIIGVPEGEATNIIKQTDSGIVIEPESPTKMREAILTLYNDRERLKRLANNSANSAALFDRKNLAKRMLNYLAAVTGKD